MQYKKTEQLYKLQQNADLKIENQNQPKMGTYRHIRIQMRKSAKKQYTNVQ